MLPQQEEEVQASPIVIDAIKQAEAGGLPSEIISSTVTTALGGIKNTATSEAAKILSSCILAKLKTFEDARKPKTWFGRFFKRIFG